MSYTPPNPSDLKARFPRFSAVDDAVIQQALDEAARLVDVSWPEGDFSLGRMLYAAHVLTTDGFGEGTEAQLNAEGVGDFQSIKLGSLSLTRFSKDAKSLTGNAFLDQLGATTYGQRFLALAARAVGAGPIVANGGIDLGTSPNARDVLNLPGLASGWRGNG